MLADEDLLPTCASITLEEVDDLLDLFQHAQKLKPHQPNYHGLRRVLRKGFDCAWVCRKGGCVAKFFHTGRLLLRFQVKEQQQPSDENAEIRNNQ